MYSKLVANFVFPLHEAVKRHDTVRINNQLERSQWWSKEEIGKYQSQRLHQFIRGVTRNVPYYQKMFAAHSIDASSIQSANDLSRLPLLTKELIRLHTEEMKSISASRLSRFSTGGSSGEPLVFYLGKERVGHDIAAKWRATRWWDVEIGDRELVVWGSPIEVGGQDLLRTLRDKLLRTELLPAFEMSPQNLDGFISRIKSFKPKMLFGYPSAFSLIAEHAIKKGEVLNDVGISVVFVTSEKLYDHQRELIESTYGCPVANGYGGRDAGFIAHQCPEDSLHITAEDIVVEIIDTEGEALPDGESGEIVITHLATKDFPFIRYRTGDVGVLSKDRCSCGRGLPVLEEIQGRSTDFIVAADGTVMHGLALIYVLREMEGIDQYKIIQEDIDLTRVLIVPNEKFSVDDAATIEIGFKERLGQNVEIEIELTKGIPKENSGKTRYVISNVKGAR